MDGTAAAEAEDDLDSNPLYARLTEEDELREDWEAARLVLVPLSRDLRQSTTQGAGEHESQKTIGHDTDPLLSDAYIALHAFAPSRLFKDQFISVRALRETTTRSIASPMPFSPTDTRPGSPLSRGGTETPQAMQSFLLADALTQDVRARTAGAQAGKGAASKADAEAEVAVFPVQPEAVEVDPWARITVTASIEPNQSGVHLLLTGPAPVSPYSPAPSTSTGLSGRRLEHTLRVVSETTIYRSVPISSGSAPPAARPCATSGFEVLSRPAHPPTQRPRTEKVRVRVCSVDGPVVPASFAFASSSTPRRPSVALLTPPKAGAEDGSRRPSAASSRGEPSPTGSIAFPSKESGENEKEEEVPDASATDADPTLEQAEVEESYIPLASREVSISPSPSFVGRVPSSSGRAGLGGEPLERVASGASGLSSHSSMRSRTAAPMSRSSSSSAADAMALALPEGRNFFR